MVNLDDKILEFHIMQHIMNLFENQWSEWLKAFIKMLQTIDPLLNPGWPLFNRACTVLHVTLNISSRLSFEWETFSIEICHIRGIDKF